MKLDIHHHKRGLEQERRRIENSIDISKKNKKLIIEFRDECIAQGLGIARIYHYMQRLKRLAIIFKKDFDRATKGELKKLVAEFESKNLSDWTKHDYKVTLKKFYKWLAGSEEYPDKIRWLKTTMKNSNHKLPSELLTEEDIDKLVKATFNARDKAFIRVLYESGCRIGELAGLKIKNIQFDDYGAQLIVDGKTGMRRIRIIASAPALATWLDNHPDKEDPDSYVWVRIEPKNSKDLLCYNGLRAVLHKAAKRAGIKKRSNPHLFRHSRATYLANKITEAQMKEIFGWTQSSEMASVYVHMSGRDTDDALLKLAGLKNEKKEESKPKVSKCSRCKELNDHLACFCRRCGLALDIKTGIELDEKIKSSNDIMTNLMKDPEKLEKVAKLIAELGFAKKLSKI